MNSNIRSFLMHLGLPIHIYTIVRHPLTAVAIEINSFCNRRCVNCPNHTYERERSFMNEALYFSTIDELKEIQYKGSLAFNGYNEPLLDKRLPTFIEYARKWLPHSYILLNTNGDLLNHQMWHILRTAGLDHAIVSQYDGRVNRNIQQLLSELQREEKKHIFVRIFDASRYANNRAGLVKIEKKVTLPLKECCIRPFYQLQINYQGKAVLCCNDYFGSVEMGDIHNQHIAEIWQNRKFQAYRRRLFFKDRASLELCNKCDARYYLPFLRRPAFLLKI
jgi:radical SAM protein with 4Fe4S-binding SPASM domain